MQVSPSSLDRIFYGWIFWKAYGWNCAQFFFSDFFLSHPKSGRFFENRKIFTYFALATFVSSKHILKTLLIESIGPQLSKKSKIFEIGSVFLKIEHFEVGGKNYFPKCEEKLSFYKENEQKIKIPKGIDNFPSHFGKYFFSPT